MRYNTSRLNLQINYVEFSFLFSLFFCVRGGGMKADYLGSPQIVHDKKKMRRKKVKQDLWEEEEEEKKSK